MKSFATLALVGAVMALPQPQAVTSAIAPMESTPAGCSENYSGSFQISVVNVTSTSKRSLEARKALTMTLSGGVLTDDEGRTGYIASNQQFQFDGPVQAGAIYTAGWSVCSNNTLALGNSAIFYQCLSGTFYNLYDESTGAQCSEIYLDVIAASGSSAATATVASQIADGQVTGTAVSQISDGQIQATTGTPAAVTQISDGQIQATTGVVVSQISDGQIQATTGVAVVSQISDGQIQATKATGAVVSQISDGQIQATVPAATTSKAVVATTSKAVVSQISDGQIQATKSTGAVVSQISDGQIQAPTNGTRATATPSISTFTGAAATAKAGILGLAAGAVALAML